MNKYSEDWEETLAKSAEEIMDTLGMIEDEPDPTRVNKTSSQGETLPLGQHAEKNEAIDTTRAWSKKSLTRLASP